MNFFEYIRKIIFVVVTKQTVGSDYTIFTIEERRFNFYDGLDKRMTSFFAIAVWGKSNFNAIWFLANFLPLVLRNEGGASFILTIGN